MNHPRCSRWQTKARRRRRGERTTARSEASRHELIARKREKGEKEKERERSEDENVTDGITRRPAKT